MRRKIDVRMHERRLSNVQRLTFFQNRTPSEAKKIRGLVVPKAKCYLFTRKTHAPYHTTTRGFDSIDVTSS